MKVNHQSVNFTIDRKLVDFLQSKLSNLEKFYDKIIDAHAYFKVENTSAKENKITEIKLNISGGEFIVKKQCKSFEEGIDLSVESLKRQLNKKKEKLRAHHS